MSKLLLIIPFLVSSTIASAEGMVWVNEYSLQEARENHLYINSSCKWRNRCELSVKVPSRVQNYPLSQILVIKNNVEVPLTFSNAEKGYSIGRFMIYGKNTNDLEVKLEYSEIADQLHWNHVYAVIPLEKMILNYEY